MFDGETVASGAKHPGTKLSVLESAAGSVIYQRMAFPIPGRVVILPLLKKRKRACVMALLLAATTNQEDL